MVSRADCRTSHHSKQITYGIFLLIVILLIDQQWNRNVDSSDRLQSISSKCEKWCPYVSKLEQEKLIFNLAYSIRHFPDFICPQNFRNLADWIYGWPNKFFESVEPTTEDGKEIAPCLSPGSIIYVRITALNQFFSEVYPHLIHNFVLITGEDDISSPMNLSYLNRPDSKIIHWFGQNGQIHAGQNPKFTHIPIGINCFEMADAIRTVHTKAYPNHLLPSLYGSNDEPAHYINPLDVTQRALSTYDIKQDHLTLINFNPRTDRTGTRSRVWSDMCNPDKSTSFTTCIKKAAGVHVFRLGLIYERNRQYPLWISPRGNGIDCHRTWEALYLDIVPIVWNSTLNTLYTNLPIIVINNHTELTESYLRDRLHEIAMKKIANLNSHLSNGYQYEKLRNAYWRRMILSKSKYVTKMFNLTSQRRCWRARSTSLEWSRLIPFLKYINPQ